MPVYQLVSFKTCPWVQRAAIVLREKGVAFEFVHIEPDRRPDWFAAVSPHGKVPVLRIDGCTSLFESNAIAEYLDEMIAPRLHPDDPLLRAVNRAWNDYVPTFSALLGAASGANDAESYTQAIDKLSTGFARLEDALATRGDRGPWFNGEAYGLVDASYAPFLQRWSIVESLTKERRLAAYPRLADWTKALVERSSTHSFPPAEFETLYKSQLARRGGWVTRAH